MTAIPTLAEAKKHLRILHNDDDSYINDLILAATGWASTTVDFEFDQSEWTQTLYGGGGLLEKRPVYEDAIISVEKYINEEWVEVDSAEYKIKPSYVGYTEVFLWPLFSYDLRVVYTTGELRPNDEKMAKSLILLMVSNLYEHREMEVVNGTVARLSNAEFLINALRPGGL